MKNHFKKIMRHSLIELDRIKMNKIYELLICSFIDILRISAPQIPFENEIMEFYLEMLVKWLMLEDHIKPKKDTSQTAFFYILHQIAKLSALSLLFTTRLIDQVPAIIHKLFYFLEKKIYTEQQYQDFLECISSTVNEYSEVPIELLQILLSYLCKDKKIDLEKQAYEAAYNVIKNNKSILGNKIRDFITPSTQAKQKQKTNKKDKNKKGKRKSTKSNNKKRKSSVDKSSIIDSSNITNINDFGDDAISFFENNNYLKIIKELSKISPDFLLKLLSELNNDGLKLTKKYFGYSSFDILRKILSNENSYEIIHYWKLLCNNFFNALKEDISSKYNENEKENKDITNFDIKFLIFKCVIKFLTRNDKDKLKEDNIYLFVKDSIAYFLKNLSVKNEIDKCLQVLVKSSNWNIISFSLISLLSSKNNKKMKIIKDFYFKIIKDQILSKLILQDFKDKKTTKMLNTLSKPFNLILSSLDDSIKLYQLSMNSKIIEDTNFSYIIKKIQTIFDTEVTHTTVKLMMFFYMSIYTQEATTIWYSLLHIIFTDNNKNIIEDEEEKKSKDKNKEDIKFLNCIEFNSENTSNKKNDEINGLIDFFNQYIIFVDEKCNPDSIKVLISILFTIEIFLCSLHYNKDTISKNNKDLLYLILNLVIKVSFNNNITNKKAFDVICKIILLSIHLCANLGNEEETDIKIKQKLNELLFVDMSEYIFKNDQIRPKYYVKLICTYYNMIESLIIKEDGNNSENEIFRIFPKDFAELLKKEKKVNCLAFVNELTFYNIDSKFSSFYFNTDLAEKIIKFIENENNEGIQNDKNEIFEIISNKSQENNINREENQEINILTKNLLPKIKLSSEIMKYELNYLLKKILNNNEDSNHEQQNFEIKNYIKNIFNKIFILINTILINKKFVTNTNKKKELNDEIYLDEEIVGESKNKKIKSKKTNKNNKNTKKNSIKESEEKIKESKKRQKDLKISNIEDIININFIQKYIDLLFYMSEIGISFSFRKLVKISNIMLVKDPRIRNYFVTKIHNSLIKLKKSHRNLTRMYSIMLLGLSDPNEKIEKNCKDIFGIFLDLLRIKLIKYEDFLNTDGYIYIPEVYIFYLIIFFIFNDNINIYYQQNSNINNNKFQNNKYFMNIFSTYLKEIKKKFGFVDSTFLLKVLNEMKKFECKNIKRIKCLDKENVFLNYDIIEGDNEDENKEKIQVNFDKVKNSVIDSVMSIVYANYLSDKKRTDRDGNGIYPQIPNILTGKDVEFKDNYLFNFYKLHGRNNVQNDEKNNDVHSKSSILNSTKKSKDNNNKKDDKRFSFNEYFKEDNDEEENY